MPNEFGGLLATYIHKVKTLYSIYSMCEILVSDESNYSW